MKHLALIFAMLLLVAGSLFAGVHVTKTDVYKTAEQMLLANEINESGEPFAEELGYDLDLLDPFVANAPDSVAYTLGIENYEYSRYQLGTIISRSGMGLHMMWAPVIRQMAAMEPDEFDGSMTGAANGYKEDDELIKNIMHFSMLANQMPPGHPWPQFADFMSGDPHLPQVIDAEKFAWADFSTLRWDRSKMDKILNPAAMGQSLMKQYLWAQDMLSAYHDSLDNGIDPDGVISPDFADSPNFDPDNNLFFGGDGLDGFIGQVLTAEAINKVKFMTVALAYDGSTLGGVDLMTYDPAAGLKYFPHKIQVTEQMVAAGLPPEAGELTVVDNSSDLFDQFSLLWGALHFANMMDPDNSSSPAHFAYHEIFDGDPFPPAMSQSGTPGPFDLMKGTSMMILKNLLAFHFNGDEGTFTDTATLDGGALQAGSHIRTINAGYIIVGLQSAISEFAGTPLEQMATNAVTMQANFIINKLQMADGAFANGYTIGQGMDAKAKTLAAQAGGIRGLYAAYQVTGNEAFLQAADKGYDYLINNFYSPAKMAFFTLAGNSTATYTPFNFAVVAGALREAALVGGHDESPVIYTRFFKTVAEVMQLSEGAATGESGGDSDGDGVPFIPEQAENLPPVFATEATLDMTTTGVASNSTVIHTFSLQQNYPNPFNPTTTIEFSVATPGNYELAVYNTQGQRVKRLLNENLSSQVYSVTFTAEDLPSGVYIYKLQGPNASQMRRLVLLK